MLIVFLLPLNGSSVISSSEVNVLSIGLKSLPSILGNTVYVFTVTFSELPFEWFLPPISYAPTLVFATEYLLEVNRNVFFSFIAIDSSLRRGGDLLALLGERDFDVFFAFTITFLFMSGRILGLEWCFVDDANSEARSYLLWEQISIFSIFFGLNGRLFSFVLLEDWLGGDLLWILQGTVVGNLLPWVAPGRGFEVIEAWLLCEARMLMYLPFPLLISMLRASF